MARIPGAAAIYEIADEFRQRCLTNGLSLLWPNDSAWVPANISAFRTALEKRVEVQGGFYAMLKAQLEDQPPSVHKVAVDVVSFYQLLIAVPTKLETKFGVLRQMIGWKLASEEPQSISP